MTDIHADRHIDGARRQRASRMEFRLYFAVILMVALPVMTVAWLADCIRTGRVSHPGPVARALSMARTIAPTIFSA